MGSRYRDSRHYWAHELLIFDEKASDENLLHVTRHASGEPRMHSTRSFSRLRVHIKRKTLIPCRKRSRNQLLDRTVNFSILSGMEIVDVAGEFDRAIILECDVRRQPLICVRPVVVRYPVAYTVSDSASILVRMPAFLLDHIAL